LFTVTSKTIPTAIHDNRLKFFIKTIESRDFGSSGNFTYYYIHWIIQY